MVPQSWLEDVRERLETARRPTWPRKETGSGNAAMRRPFAEADGARPNSPKAQNLRLKPALAMLFVSRTEKLYGVGAPANSPTRSLAMRKVLTLFVPKSK